MSTNALIMYQNNAKTYDCIEVNYDGYVKEGVGETLTNFWKNPEDVKNLCKDLRSIRTFGVDFDDIEFYRPGEMNCGNQMKNLSLEDAINLASSYCYAYLFFPAEDNMESFWALYIDREDIHSYDWEPVNLFL